MSEPKPTERFGGLRLSTTVLVRLLVSLALALLLWGWVTTQQDPIETEAYSDLALRPPDLGDDLAVFSDLGQVRVRLVLEGPRSVLREIDARDLEPTLDLSGIDDAGGYTVPVTVAVPPGARLDRISPRNLPINVDREASQTFDLEPYVEPPADGIRQIGTPQPAVSEVQVGGPERVVAEVERVVLPIAIGDRAEDFAGTFIPEAQNAAGEILQGVRILPAQVRTEVPIQTRGQTVPVLIQTAGTPAEGYERVDSAANPATVVLDGPDEALAEVVSVQTEPVSIDGATEQVTQRVGLTGLPAGVRVVDPPSGEVYAVVQVRQRGTTQRLQNLPLTIIDLGPGLEASLEPTTLDVVVFAADAALSGLRGGDVEPSVSLEGLGPGSHEVAPIVALPPTVQWIESDPERVRVVIRPSTPPPGASPERQLP